MIYLIITFLSFLITILVTPYLISYLLKKDLVDKPNGEARRMHSEPVPRLGGLVIFSVIMIITFAFYRDFDSKKYFFIGAFIVFILGLIDDIKPIKWYVKFAVQFAAAILLMISLKVNNYTDMFFMGYHIVNGFDYLVLFILIVGLLNSFNLMDGLDGLVAGFSLIVAALGFLLMIGQDFLFLPSLISATIGTTLGFLKFNANPARIFLGDSGAYTLGYIIAGMVLGISGEVSGLQTVYPHNTRVIDLAFVIIVLAVPIADTLRVMGTRLLNKRNPFLPDNNHLHHILYSQKIRHKTVVLMIHLFSVLFMLTAVFYSKISQEIGLLIFIGLLLILFFIKQLLEIILNKGLILKYGKIYKRVPSYFLDIYKTVLIPLISIALIILFAILIAYEVRGHGSLYFVFFLFILASILYASLRLKKYNYYAELLVLVNFIVFFLLTGLNGFFYKLHPVPVITQINLNQVFIAVLSLTIAIFLLFKERISNIRQNFLTGADLTLAVLILFVYLTVQMLNIPLAYKISDTLLRSFLVFLFYKIIIIQKPKLHFPLYYTTFGITIFAIIKSLI